MQGRDIKSSIYLRMTLIISKKQQLQVDSEESRLPIKTIEIVIWSLELEQDRSQPANKVLTPQFKTTSTVTRTV
jgi:hypothetical protein